MAAARTSEGPTASPLPEEAELVRRAREGDEAAFESLYRAHAGRIHALCWRLCAGDEALAGDMLQEAFIRAWEKLAQFRGEAAFGTWLHRLTVNLVLSQRRRLARLGAHEQPLEGTRVPARARDPGPGGGDRDLEQAIARLPERARLVLVLHDVEGYRHKEIAAMAGMAVGTSKAQLHRARKLVREWLER